LIKRLIKATEEVKILTCTQKSVQELLNEAQRDYKVFLLASLVKSLHTIAA
jgi:hypothetical protein